MNDETKAALWRIGASWCGALWGWFTLQHLVLILSALYTGLQVYVLWRDKIARSRDENDR